jgi:copper resistance protein B
MTWILITGLARAQEVAAVPPVLGQTSAEQPPQAEIIRPGAQSSQSAISVGTTGNAAALAKSGAAGAGDLSTLPNLSERSKWPSPVADNANYSYVLFDLLEFQRIRGINALRWDALGWYGGDKRRLWIKSEGEQYTSSRTGGEADVQALYGKLIAPFFDLQAGVRYEKHFETNNPQRVFAVVGLQGLAPGRFDIEPAFSVSNKGKTSVRFSGTYDTLLTQRLILQPRFETEIAFQRDSEFGVVRGVNDVEIGLRLRYEIRRELAPYFGVTFRQSFDATAQRVQREGGVPNALEFVIGLRMWH